MQPLSRQFLYLFGVARRPEPLYGTYLIGVHLYSPEGDHIPEELTGPHTKDALISIEMQFMLLKYFKYLEQIVHVSPIFSALHDHIITPPSCFQSYP